MVTTTTIPNERLAGLDVHQGDILQILASGEREFVVRIERSDRTAPPDKGSAAAWVRSARGLVPLTLGVTPDEVRMDFYASKFHLPR